MKNHKKSIITAFTLLLLISMLMLTVFPSSVNAIQMIDTNAYAMVSPDVVGVGQTVVVSYRIDKVKTDARILTNHFEGFSLTITKPDGTTENKQNLDVDSTSGGWITYVPTEIGTYTFVTHFPEQWANGTTFENLYLSSTSAPTELTVQEDPISGLPDIPLPTEPWRKPISAENKGWGTNSDNWLMENYDTGDRSFCMTSAVAPYSTAPNSAHILWKKPIVYGGLPGGKFGDTTYYTGLSYEQFYLPYILEDRIIYVDHGPSRGTAFGTAFLDLYTGEEITYLEDITIAFAQVVNIDNPNEHGTLAYLWSISGPSSNTTLTMWDAFAIKPILTIINVPWGGLGGFSGGGTAFGPNGEILSYRLSTSAKTLTCWNSTKAIDPFSVSRWNPNVGATIDGSLGIEYNVTIPNMPSGIGISAVGSGYVLAEGRDQSAYPWTVTAVGFNAATGQMVWTKEHTDVYTAFFARATSVRDGMYVVRDEGEMTTHAYDITTGNKMWETEPLPNGWGIFEYQRDIAYGKVFTTGYTGDIRAYNAETGVLEWAYDMGNAGYETVYGVYPTYNGFTIADGKIFVGNDEHSSDGVLWRGSKLHAVDTETGEKVWDIAGMFRNPAIANGLLTALNSYDGQVYTFGKGPSATTVSAPQVQVTLGETVVICGTVTDQTPASIDTPAISDEDMTAWMEYLHMQKPIPADAKGVPVTIDVLDSNGNYYNIGTVTSDVFGKYSLIWEPSISGPFSIFATFAGTESYGSSSDTTTMFVAEPPEATSPPEQTPAPPTETYIAGSTIAILAGIAVAVFLILRKK